MKIENIAGANVIPRGVMENSTKYVDSVTTDKKEPDVLEKIRDESKGNKIDTSA